MTHDRPNRRTSWAGKIVISLFLLVVGGMANQFLNIPVQQQRQDDHIQSLERHMEYNDARLDKFERQHEIMERQLDELKVMHTELLTKHAKKK